MVPFIISLLPYRPPVLPGLSASSHLPDMGIKIWGQNQQVRHETPSRLLCPLNVQFHGRLHFKALE